MKEHFKENESVSCRIEDNILYHVYKKSFVDLQVAKESVETKIALCGKQNYPTLINIRKVKSTTKEAREYLSSSKGLANISVAAILAPTLISKLIGTFFMTFNSPKVKTKLFNDKDEAITWLQKEAEHL